MITFILIFLLSVVFGGFCLVIIENFIDMKKDSHYHPWPSVTRCRICDKRVFVWQMRERRGFTVELDNPRNLAVGCSSSGIVHKHCKGNPVFKMSVK